MPNQDIQVTFPESFNVKNVIFDPIQKRKIPGGGDDKDNKNANTYQQIAIRMKYPDGSEGPLIFQLPRCPTFGISKGMNGEETADKLSLAICLGNRDNYSAEQKRAVAVLEEFILACKKHILTDDVKTALGEEDLEMRDLTGNKKEISPLRPQKDKDPKDPNKVVNISTDVKPPYLYAKMLTRNDKESGTKVIESRFYYEDREDSNGNPVEADPYDFIGKAGYCTALIKFESIYFGTKKKIQVKVYQCDLKENNGGFRSLIVRPPKKKSAAAAVDEDDADDQGAYDDVEEEPASAAAVTNEVDMEEEVAEEEEEEEAAEPATPARAPSPAPVAATPAKTVRRGTSKK